MPYFKNFGPCNDPGKQELHEFLQASRDLLSDLLGGELKLENRSKTAVPHLLNELGPDALNVFHQFVDHRFDLLHACVEQASPDVLKTAGVIGPEQSLRLRELAATEELVNTTPDYWPQIATLLRQADLTLDATLHPLAKLAPSVDEFAGLFKQYRLTVCKLVTG